MRLTSGRQTGRLSHYITCQAQRRLPLLSSFATEKPVHSDSELSFHRPELRPATKTELDADADAPYMTSVELIPPPCKKKRKIPIEWEGGKTCRPACGTLCFFSVNLQLSAIGNIVPAAKLTSAFSSWSTHQQIIRTRDCCHKR